MKKVNQDFSYSKWREHFNLVSLHRIQRPHTNQQKKHVWAHCAAEKRNQKEFLNRAFSPFFLSWTPPIFRGTIYYKWLLKGKTWCFLYSFHPMFFLMTPVTKSSLEKYNMNGLSQIYHLFFSTVKNNMPGY